MTEAATKSYDPASIKMIEKATYDEVNTAFDRAEAMKPCPIGAAALARSHKLLKQEAAYKTSMIDLFLCQGRSECILAYALKAIEIVRI